MGLEDQYNKIYRFCYYRMRHRQIAEDLTQETFLRFFQSGYEERGMAIRYLYTIARNLCVEESRKAVWEPMEEDLSDEGAASEELLERVRIRQALWQLSEEDRELLILRYQNGESLATLCALTGESRFALYRRLNRIKTQLQRMLE